MTKPKTHELEAPLAPTPAPKVPLLQKGAALGSALALGVTLGAGCGDDGTGEPPMAVMGDTGIIAPMPPPQDTGVVGDAAPMDTGAASDTGADADGSTGDAALDTSPPPPMPPPVDAG